MSTASTPPPQFMCHAPEPWAAFVQKNSDNPYGMGIVRFAEAWASEMERSLQHENATLWDCAENASIVANQNMGISGAMYGCAVAILARVWIHGEALRRWHNLKVGGSVHGAHANESGGIVDPAVLSVGRA